MLGRPVCAREFSKNPAKKVEKKSHFYQQRPFSTYFCTGMQTSYMRQFGAGMQTAVMLIQ